MTIGEDYGIVRPKLTGRASNGDIAIGVEIELEKVQLKDVSILPWKLVQDGSLKDNGLEFTQAMWAKEAREELEHLYSCFETPPKATKRTSIHIHVDITKYNLEQLKALLYCYIIFERALMQYAGVWRQDSNYCIPVQDLIITRMREYTVADLRAVLRKYTAIHLMPENNDTCYGTLEFRQLQGTTNIRYIITWIEIIKELVNNSIKLNPNNIIVDLNGLYKQKTYWQLAEQLFPKTLIALNNSEFRDNVEDGLFYLKACT